MIYYRKTLSNSGPKLTAVQKEISMGTKFKFSAMLLLSIFCFIADLFFLNNASESNYASLYQILNFLIVISITLLYFFQDSKLIKFLAISCVLSTIVRPLITIVHFYSGSVSVNNLIMKSLLGISFPLASVILKAILFLLLINLKFEQHLK